MLAPPDAEYAILQQATSAPKRANPLNIISFYRQYARRCEAAARDAPNEQMRAEHSKMVHVWREFAAEHERMVHEGGDFAGLLNQSLKDWFLAHRIREAMAPLSAIVMGGEGKVIEADETYVGGNVQLDPGVGALRIEIVDPKAPGETITIEPQPVRKAHDTDDGAMRLTFAADEDTSR